MIGKRQQSPAARAAGLRNIRPWKPGQSGNPSGRPKWLGEIQTLARQYGPEALARLVSIMRSRDTRAAMAAAQVLLERGYGRPDSSHTGAPLVNLNIGNLPPNGDLTLFDSFESYRLLLNNPQLDDVQQRQILAHMKMLAEEGRRTVGAEPPAIVDAEPPGTPRATSPALARLRAAAVPPDPESHEPGSPTPAPAQPDALPALVAAPPPPTPAETAAARRAVHEARNEADAARRREGLRARERAEAAAMQPTEPTPGQPSPVRGAS